MFCVVQATSVYTTSPLTGALVHVPAIVLVDRRALSLSPGAGATPVSESDSGLFLVDRRALSPAPASQARPGVESEGGARKRGVRGSPPGNWAPKLAVRLHAPSGSSPEAPPVPKPHVRTEPGTGFGSAAQALFVTSLWDHPALKSPGTPGSLTGSAAMDSHEKLRAARRMQLASHPVSASKNEV